MSLSIRPPVVPPADADYSAARESANAKSLEDVISAFQKMVDVLDAYAPKSIVDALGRHFDALAKDTGSVALPGFPWQAIDVSDEGGFKVSVPPFSAVYSDSDGASEIVISGLGGVFDAVLGHVLYIEIPISDGNVAGNGTLKCGVPWDGYPKKYKTEAGAGDPPVDRQTTLFIPIAYFGAELTTANVLPGVELSSGAETLQCYQLVRTHLAIVRGVLDGVSLVGSVPWPSFSISGKPVDVLVGMRLYGGQLQGKYKTVWVMDDEAGDPEWRNLIAMKTSVPTTCP
jgi:hypothetical protein